MNKLTWLVSSALVAAAGPAIAQTATPPAEPTPPTPPTAPTPPAPPAEPAAPVAVPVDAIAPVPAEAPKKDDKPAVGVTYDGGVKFATADDKYELKLQFRTQARFEANRSLDEETPTQHNQWKNRFYVPRARLQAEGQLFDGDARFKLEVGFGDSGSFGYVKDMFIEKKLDDKLYLRLGQWKRPFNRMEMVSDYSSTFNERAIENELAGGGRDLGLAIHNDYEKSPAGLEWVVGIFNGFSGGSDRPAFCTDPSVPCVNPRPSNFPADFGPTLLGRVAFNSPKMKGYSESDLEGGPLRYSVGAAYKVDLANFSDGGKDSWSDNMKHGVEVDALVKNEGLCIHAGAVLMKIQDADANFGVLLQPGYMVVPKKIELAARFSLTTEKEKDRNQIEARAAFNYFFHGHTWKLATDGGFLQYTGDGANDDKPDLQFRAMLQLQI